MTTTAPFAVASPVDGHPLPEVRATPLEGLTAQITASRQAAAGWASAPLDQRASQVTAMAEAILRRREEIAAIIHEETGRGPVQSQMAEVIFVLEYARDAVKVARKALAPEKLPLSRLNFPGKSGVTEAVPRGVVGIIAPWNYPLSNFYKSLFPALLSGNGVIMKPSEYTPRTGAWLYERCVEFLPGGLVQLLQGGGEAGAALLESDIDAIVFTGSVATGRKVAAAAGKRLIPCSVELGGKDPAIVLADCNLDRTVIGVAQWSMFNTGQDCSSIERIYVEDAIADEFVRRLTVVASSLTVAGAAAEPTDMGPLQNERQVRIVEEHVADAMAKGAKLLCGGKRTGKGCGFEPTVLDHCTHEMRIITDETFGPVAAVIRVKDAEQAIAHANSTVYGLNGSVWTSNLERGAALARRIHAGVVYVNNHSFLGTNAFTPWTGVRDTGPGVAASVHAYHTFVRRRTVLMDSNNQPDPWWFPANADLAEFAGLVAEKSRGSLMVIPKLLGVLSRRTKAVQELARKGGK
ncbi:MAG: NAD/NADP-dependent betaine aldehyde dehydrogenase [Myxococcota bacterium]|nr:NAD/NADP-dependent betaine aldehyde dehydrogenase [Myxococcota bacterium]